MGRAVLADVCRKTGVHWVVGGEVRANPKGSWSVLLSLGDSGEVVHFRPIEVPPENPGPALEQALLELLKTAKVPLATPEVARVETPPPAPTPTVTAAAPSPSATPLALASASPAPILGPDPHSSAAGPSSVPAQALPGPVVQRSGGGGGFHPRWYVIAGAVAVIGAGAALAAGASSKSGSGQSGITLTITR